MTVHRWSLSPNKIYLFVHFFKAYIHCPSRQTCYMCWMTPCIPNPSHRGLDMMKAKSLNPTRVANGRGVRSPKTWQKPYPGPKGFNGWKLKMDEIYLLLKEAIVGKRPIGFEIELTAAPSQLWTSPWGRGFSFWGNVLDVFWTGGAKQFSPCFFFSLCFWVKQTGAIWGWLFSTFGIWFGTVLLYIWYVLEALLLHCWWKKSQTTTWDVSYPVNNGIFFLPYQLVFRISSINSILQNGTSTLSPHNIHCWNFLGIDNHSGWFPRMPVTKFGSKHWDHRLPVPKK